jgi:hypothetical protein
VAAPAGVASDLQIIQALAERVGLSEPLAGSARQWKERLIGPELRARGIDLSTLEARAVHNPLAPRVLFEGRRFATDSGRVNLITRGPTATLVRDPDYPLTMMALSTRLAQSSQWALDPPQVLTASVHPRAAGGLPDGARCLVESSLSAIEVELRHDATQRDDVLLLPKGGHHHLNACANALLEGRLTDLGEGGALYDQPVRLRPLSSHPDQSGSQADLPRPT